MTSQCPDHDATFPPAPAPKTPQPRSKQGQRARLGGVCDFGFQPDLAVDLCHDEGMGSPPRRALASLATAAPRLVAGCGARSSLLDLPSAPPSTTRVTSTSTTSRTTTSADAGAGGGPVVRCGFGERFGDARGQHVTSMVVDAQGGIVLGGTLIGRADLGGVTLDAGVDTSSLRGPAFVAKLDAEGRPLWGKVLGRATRRRAPFRFRAGGRWPRVACADRARRAARHFEDAGGGALARVR